MGRNRFGCKGRFGNEFTASDVVYEIGNPTRYVVEEVYRDGMVLASVIRGKLNHSYKWVGGDHERNFVVVGTWNIARNREEDVDDE